MRRMGLWLVGIALGTMLLGAGCGPAVGGPRFWWDDKKRERLPDDYALPPLSVSSAPEEATETAAPVEPAAAAEKAPAAPAPGASDSSALVIPAGGGNAPAGEEKKP